MIINKEIIKIFFLYFFLMMGGLWELLGLFKVFNQTFAGIILILLSLWGFYEIYNYNSKNENSKISIIKSILFFLIVVIVSFIIEIIGVKTGLIFGEYQYSKVLIPQIFDTPVAIGFAWFSTLISSTAILKKLIDRYYLKLNILFKSLIIGFLMFVFDYFLEPAAIKLNYWNWQLGIVPFQNYLSWFIFGSLFAYIGYKLEYLNLYFPKIIIHFYFSQILYFIIIYFK
jgi:putative membrane protein